MQKRVLSWGCVWEAGDVCAGIVCTHTHQQVSCMCRSSSLKEEELLDLLSYSGVYSGD